MSTIDPNKKTQKIRTEEEISQALSNFCQGKHTMTVPPQDSDDDVVLYDAFNELLEARKRLVISSELAALAWGMANANNACISDLQRQVSLLHEEIFCTHANRPATKNQTLLGDVRELRRMVFSLQEKDAEEQEA